MVLWSFRKSLSRDGAATRIHPVKSYINPLTFQIIKHQKALTIQIFTIQNLIMTTNSTHLQSKTEQYSQQLAIYTLRQFSAARSSLDQQHSAAMSRLPAAYSRVARADKLASMLGQPSSESHLHPPKLTRLIS